MSAPSRVRRLFRWRLRNILLLVALIGLGIGIWTSDVYCAWVYHLLGRPRDAWNAAIQAPRSEARDRVLVATLAAIIDDERADVAERCEALLTLSCLVPAASAALPVLDRALEKRDRVSLAALVPLEELSRVDPEATRVLLAHRGSTQLNDESVWCTPLCSALQVTGHASYPLLELEFLAAIKDPRAPTRMLLPVVAAITKHGTRAAGLVPPLARLAADPEAHKWLRAQSLLALAAMGSDAAPALPSLLAILNDPATRSNAVLRNALAAAFDVVGEHAHAYYLRALTPPPPPTVRRQLAQVTLQPAGLTDFTELEGVPSRLRELAPIEQRTVIRALRAAGPAVAPIKAGLGECLPLVAPECRDELLLLVASLGAPDAHVRALLHVELRSRPLAAAARLARDWVLRADPDRVAMGVLRQFGREAPASLNGAIWFGSARFSVEVSTASRNALKSLAVEWIDVPQADFRNAGAALLANIEPEHSALQRWLFEQLAATAQSKAAERAFALELASWLGQHARAVTPLLFPMLREPESNVARIIRHIEGRPGWESDPCASR